MTGKMSLSAMLYFAANPSDSENDVLAHLTRNIRDSRREARSGMRTRKDSLSRKIAGKQNK